MRRIVPTALAVAFLTLACAGERAGSTASRPSVAGDGRPDSWRVIARSPLKAGYGYRGVWSGKEVLIWGGSYLDRDTLRGVEQRSGAAYDPSKDSWRRIPEAPIKGGGGYSVTWADDEMIVWGDPDSGRATKGNRGAAYDPRTDEWRRIPSGPLAPRSGHLAAWTGNELVVWGGWLTRKRREAYDGMGAAFNPDANSWRVLPAAPLPPGYDAKGAWTGEEVIVMTTPMGTDPEDYPKFDEVAAYDPASDTWRELARPPHVSWVSAPVAYLDGKLAVLSLGGTVDGGEVNGYGREYETGGVYDYEDDEWSPHAEPPTRPPQTWEQTAMEEEIVIDALAYRPSTDTWRTLPKFPLREREFPVVVWTGDELVVWGGAESALGNTHVDPPPALKDGAAYTPPR